MLLLVELFVELLQSSGCQSTAESWW